MVRRTSLSKGTQMPSNPRKVLRALGVLVATLAIAGIGWFAAKTTLTSSAPEAEAPAERVISTVEEQSVGKSLNYSVTSTLPTTPIFYNALVGTVTTLSAPKETKEGDVLYSVDNVPVRAVQSDVVFYRALAPGTRGKDVAALQGALGRLGYLAGSADGVWGPGTTAAVKKWQKDLGIAQSGSVQLGELVAVDQLPRALALSDTLALGKPIAEGDPTVSAGSGERTFAMILDETQSRAVPQDTAVDIIADEATWPAVITGLEEDENGNIRYLLEAPNGGPPCLEKCATLGSAPSITLRAQQHVIPKISGPAVPTIAVRTDDAGQTYVLREDNSTTPVKVLGSGNGFSIIEGLNVGDTVVILEAPSQSVTQPDAKAGEGQ